MLWGRRQRVAGPIEAIVVPGARVYPDGRPSPALVRRAEAAAALWARHPHAVVVASGAGGEADAICALLRARGVPEAQLRREPRATSTLTNALRSADLLGDVAIAVVSCDFHLLRCRVAFRACFREVHLHPAHTARWPWRAGAREAASLPGYAARALLLYRRRRSAQASSSPSPPANRGPETLQPLSQLDESQPEEQPDSPSAPPQPPAGSP